MVELRREIYDTLRAWKAKSKQECLLIKGARQIGKTYIVRKFGRECYENFVEINFIEHEEFIPVFDKALDANTILSGITALLPNVKFVPGRTLLFLDEIQECPNARTALKFLATDERCDVVASGSLLGIKYKKGRKRKPPKSYPVGYERQLTMHSLSFREYLWAKGYSDEQFESLRESFVQRSPVQEAVNERFNSLVREYIVVGGMPEVVRTFVETGHYGEVQLVQEKILTAYVDDIHKYAEAPDIPKIENCHRAIPRILAGENHKFKYSEVEKGGTARKYLSSVTWLRDAHLATLAECVGNLELGLAAYVREDWFKLYMSDVGLLSAMYGMAVKRAVLDGSLAGSVKGGIYENFICGELERRGFPVRYFKTEQGDSEVEFVIENTDGVVPVEVKAGNGATASLDRALRRPAVPYGYKFTAGNVGVAGKKITLPHYMVIFMDSAISGTHSGAAGA